MASRRIGGGTSAGRRGEPPAAAPAAGGRRRRGTDWRRVAIDLAERLPLERWHPRVRGWADESRRSRRPWSVAFSGGADSLALLLLLWAHWPQRRERLTALHFNHRLRGRAATGDARFCAAVGRALGVVVRVGEWADPPPAASEAQARAARMAFITSEMRRIRSAALWLGHHQDDVAETLLMRLARGSGTAGLAAPRPLQRLAGGRVHLRPLLPLAKAELTDALRQVGAEWREDASNAGGGHFRNRLRHGVLAAWVAAAGRDAVAGAALSRERMEEDDEALEQWLEELAPWGAGGTLELGPLAGRPTALWRRALHRWLLLHPHDSDLSRHGFEDLLSKARAGRATRFSLGARGFARIRAGRIMFERR